ncbi:MAG: glycerophosphodiester phosphodiesterase [Bacteroidia bacterium]|nr:glycerophosphodiester phosphodiesterase [Bacteroidia bacterium]
MKKYLIILIIGISSACVPQQKLAPSNPFLLEDGMRPWIIAHGGSKDLFPENTMIAFNGSVQIGIDALEIDLCMTKDEQIVCHHDLTIDRTSDGEGDLINYTFEELQEFNFGADFTDIDGMMPYKDSLVHIPLLQEVIESFPSMPLIIELKNRAENGKRAAEKLKDLLDNYDLKDRVIVASFSKEVLDHFAEITDNKYMVSGSEAEVEDFVFSGLSGVAFLYRPKSVAVQIPMSQAGINLSTRRIINSAHSRNMAVHYWTIDDKDDMKLLLDNGADGLITDRPDLMWEVLEEMGFER